MCHESLKRYKASVPKTCKLDEPVFREKFGECFTSVKLNKCLDEISAELKWKGIVVKTIVLDLECQQL